MRDVSHSFGTRRGRSLLVGALFSGLLVSGSAAFAQDEEEEAPEAEEAEAKDEGGDEAAGADDAEPEVPSAEEALGEKKKVKPSAATKAGAVAAEPGAEPQVSETHIVNPKDTLWDLCSKYLNSPWYWPKIWSYNPQITNPNWIYPGNELRFYPSDESLPTNVEVSRDLAMMDGSEDDVPTLIEPEELVKAVGNIKVGNIASGSVIRSHSVFVASEQHDLAGVIENSPEESQLLSDTQAAYVKFKEEPRKGERFAVYRTEKRIEHPVTGELLGYAVEILGAVRVVETSPEVATIVFERTFDPVERGDFVGKLPETFGRRVQPAPNQKNLKGYIVDTMEDGLAAIGEHHIVFIDRGSSEGVQPGNTFVVYQRGDQFTDDVEGLPNEIVGQIIVLDVQESASTAMVVRSLYDLGVGDKIEMFPSG